MSLAARIDLPSALSEFGDRVVYRVWRVVPEHHRRHADPVLAGLGGFLWRDRHQQARCDEGRLHRVVPDPQCTCGIYARLSGVEPQRLPIPASRPLAAGFVALSGRVLAGNGVVRASAAEIVGPLHLLTPRRPWWRRSGRPNGVVAAAGDYLVSWGRGSARFDEWLAETAATLAARYGVEVA